MPSILEFGTQNSPTYSWVTFRATRHDQDPEKASLVAGFLSLMSSKKTLPDSSGSKRVLPST